MTNDEATENTAATPASPQRPIHSMNGGGGLQVAVWKNRNEAGIDHYSIKLERSYKDGKGDFKTTEFLRESDLLRAQKLLDSADDWIEQDRQKSRRASQQSHER